MNTVYEKNNLVQQPYSIYLKRYQEANPSEISNRLQIPYFEEITSFYIRFLGRNYYILHPGFEIKNSTQDKDIYTLEQDIQAKILLLHYFLEGDGVPFAGTMISYHDLPWGEVYYRQFQKRCIFRLARTYGNHLDIFKKVLGSLNAVPADYGDSAYKFELMNGLWLCFILWQGDEEFAPTAQILFSDNFTTAFMAEDVAYIGDIVMNYMKNYERGIKK